MANLENGIVKKNPPKEGLKRDKNELLFGTDGEIKARRLVTFSSPTITTMQLPLATHSCCCSALALFPLSPSVPRWMGDDVPGARENHRFGCSHEVMYRCSTCLWRMQVDPLWVWVYRGHASVLHVFLLSLQFLKYLSYNHVGRPQRIVWRARGPLSSLLDNASPDSKCSWSGSPERRKRKEPPPPQIDDATDNSSQRSNTFSAMCPLSLSRTYLAAANSHVLMSSIGVSFHVLLAWRHAHLALPHLATDTAHRASDEAVSHSGSRGIRKKNRGQYQAQSASIIASPRAEGG